MHKRIVYVVLVLVQFLGNSSNALVGGLPPIFKHQEELKTQGKKTSIGV